MTNRVAATFLLLASALIGLAPLALTAWVWIVVITAAVGTGTVGLAVWRSVQHGRRLGDDPDGDRRWARSIFLVAIVARLLLLGADHYLSNDAFRYHWDGKTLAHGINPYRHAPAEEKVAHLRSHEIDELINHPELVTVYPPYAELVFGAGYLLSPGRLVGMQVLALLSEIACWFVLFGAASRRRLPHAVLLIPAWLPLAVFESYLPGHTEAFALPFIALFLAGALDRTRSPYRIGVALGLAALVKPVALLFVPAAVRELGVRRALAGAGAFLATIVVLYLPFLGAGENLTSSMLLMARKWEFNAGLAGLLGQIVPEPAHRGLLAVLLLAGVLAATRFGRDFLSRITWALVALVAVTPTLYPWYLIWAIPVLTLRPNASLIALSGLVPLAHVAVIPLYTTGTWNPPIWPAVVAHGTFYVLLLAGMTRRLSRRSVAART